MIVCTQVEYPRRGGIAPSQFLAYTTKLDGSPLENPRLTGEFAH